jgi:hypothetical protein
MVGTIENYVKVFQIMGFTQCQDAALAPGFEKVAIYQSADGEFTHVARQLSSGLWRSKMGPYQDIEHQTPGALSDNAYGVPSVFLHRRITIWTRLRDFVVYLWCKSEGVH